MRSCLMYLVSGGSGIGATSWSSEIGRAALLRGGKATGAGADLNLGVGGRVGGEHPQQPDADWRSDLRRGERDGEAGASWPRQSGVACRARGGGDEGER